MLDGSPMTDDQRAHVAVLGREWGVLAPLLRRAPEHTGGMAFKRVSGFDYLVRYWSHPVTGRKAFRSLGRRSPATEAELSRWLAERTEHRAALADSSTRMALQCRLAKAHRLARTPSRIAEMVRLLWKTSAFEEGLAVCGVTSLHAFETISGELGAPRLFRGIEEEPDLELVSASDPARWSATVQDAMGRRNVRVERAQDGIKLSIDDGRRMLVRRRAGFNAKRDVVRALAIARDCTPVEILSVGPGPWLDMLRDGRKLRPLDLERIKFVDGLGSRTLPW